jgi:pyruvate carboxylase
VPTQAFLYGLKPGQEIAVEIEEGKILFVRLLHIADLDKTGYRTLTFELNGRPRESVDPRQFGGRNRGQVPASKADPADPLQVGAPIGGSSRRWPPASAPRSTKGDRLATVEAMKMLTTVYAPVSGVVTEVHAAPWAIPSRAKDLLMRLQAS